MSRSNPTQTNPAKRFFRWSGSKGVLVYYDKENQKEVEVKLPFEFLVLDQLSTITGYSDQDQSGFWSNEVRSVGKEPLTVRTKKGIKEVGLYADLKGSVALVGAKYAKSVYIAYKDGDQFVLGNIQAYGAALTAWIDVSNKHTVENGKITLTGGTEAKKGSTTYFVPTFEWSACDKDEDEAALRLDRELQTYLNQYLAARKSVFEDDPVDDWVPNEDEIPNEEELNAALNG